MCLAPIKIPNKNHNRPEWTCDQVRKYKDYKSAYMEVPCGVCKQCVAMAQIELIQRVQMEAMHNVIFMGTMTYDELHLPKLTTEQWEDKKGYLQPGYTYRYAKYEDASAAIKRMRNENVYGIPFKYLIITERGSLRQRPHFHCLLLFKRKDLPTYRDILDFEQQHKWTLLENWKRNVGSRTHPLYTNLCTYVESYRGGKLRATYDFHYVNPALTKSGVTDAAFYVLKYMMKGKQNLDTKRALILNYGETGFKYWDRIKDRREYSLGFGLDIDYSKQGKDRTITEEICNKDIIDYLKQCIDRSKKAKNPYAYYYCPEALNTFPLADYYKKKGFIYTLDDEEYFYDLNPEAYRASREKPEHLATSQALKQFTDFEKILELQQFEDIADNFDELLTT